MNIKPPDYKDRIWIANTWNKNLHCSSEAQCFITKKCTCIRCLIEKTMYQDPIMGPAFFKEDEEENPKLVGLYLRYLT